MKQPESQGKDTVEFSSPESWGQLHTELLQSTVNRVYTRVPFYRKAMEKNGIKPDIIDSALDLYALPFTTRKDLSDNYPYNFFAVPLRDIVRIHSLRLGISQPLALGYTKQDIEHRRGLAIRFLTSCHVIPEDIVQFCLDPGLAVKACDLAEGAEALGALVIPPDPLSTDARIRILADFKTTTIVTTPSYLVYLLAKIPEMGIPLASLSLRRAILVGESLADALRDNLEVEFGIQAISAYGIMEAGGPCLAYECENRQGLHVAIDHVIPEIVEPGTDKVLPAGEAGELVITTLTARANPLVRFRTGDITRLIKEPCACGRTTWRIMPVVSRCDALISVRGVLLDSTLIEKFFEKMAQKKLDFVIIVKNRQGLQSVEVWVSVSSEFFTGSLPDLHNWIRIAETAFEEVFGIGCIIKPVELETIARWLSTGQKVVHL